MIRRLLARFAPTYCGSCGWWVENCPHQSSSPGMMGP